MKGVFGKLFACGWAGEVMKRPYVAWTGAAMQIRVETRMPNLSEGELNANRLR